MAIGPGDQSMMQARGGIARGGAVRGGYFKANWIIGIDHPTTGIEADLTPYIRHGSLRIQQVLNDEIDTASLTLLPTMPFVPAPRSRIYIALGARSNLLFAGQVMSVHHRRDPGFDVQPWCDLMCVDHMAVFDAHFVTYDWPAQSATLTINDLVQRFCYGAGFSTSGVPDGLPTHEGFSVTNQRPSTVLRQITNRMGGGFVIDANRIVRVWAAGGDPAGSSPQPLTDTLRTLKSFSWSSDGAQQRTRVYVEGKRTTALLPIPAWPTSTNLWVPVEDASFFPVDPVMGVTVGQYYVRIGTQFFEYLNAVQPGIDPVTQNPVGTVLTADIAPGTSTLFVQSTAGFPSSAWAKVGGQIVSITVYDEYRFLMPTDYGGLKAPVSKGDSVTSAGAIYVIGLDVIRTGSFNPDLPLVRSSVRAQAISQAVVSVIMRQRYERAWELRPREDSDGYLEHLVQDGRYSYTGGAGRGESELDDFQYAPVRYSWETEDMNAQAGKLQAIAVTGPPASTVRITSVEIVPQVKDRPPRRTVTATSRASTAGVLDTWVNDPR
jgi:hypothetical protein